MSVQLKVAVVGAGFSGLATAWHLLKRGFAVTLFDLPDGKSKASVIAAGLLHYHSGQHAKYNREGKESYDATVELLKIASESLGKDVFKPTGLIRPALSESQQLDFQLAASKYPEVKWLKAEECQRLVPGIASAPGIMIESALTIYADLYLEGLLQAFQRSNGQVIQQKITSLKELESFNHVVLAPGDGVVAFESLLPVNLRRVKGQILELEWPKNLKPLSFPLNSQAYIVMSQDNTRCIVGATFERNFVTEAPDVETALQDILPKAVAIFPAIQEMKLLSCKSGVRVTGPLHLPYITQLNAKTSFIVGMGSKGLLYHAAYAKKLVDRIVIA